MNERLLQFHDPEIERKYYEDEYLRIIQVLKYQVYLGSLVSVVLVIMAFIESNYALFLGGMSATLMLPIFILLLAKKFPYKCNAILSINNISWCLLISAAYMWSPDSIISICSKGDDSSENASSCSYLFVLGGGFYTLHLALLIGTNFILNVSTFTAINTIYVFSVFPSIANLLCILILAPVCVGITAYAREKNARLYYELINKYYIWYHIANNVLPQRIILTKTSQKGRDAFQLYKLNRRARKEYNINTNEDLQQFIQKIDIKLDSHQSIPIYEDQLNIHNHMDSLHSKSLGVISQVSKKSLTSRQSQKQPKLLPLDILLRREIRRQNSNDMQGGVDQPSTNNHALAQIQNQNTNNQNGIGVNTNNNFNNNNNLNTTTQDQGAQYMRNKKRSLFQMEDPGLQSIANPSQKQSRKYSKKTLKRTKLEKYKGVFKNDIEEKRKFQLTLVCYNKDEQYQLIMIEDDNGVQKDQLLDEQMQQYKAISTEFGLIMQNEANLLNFYLQQMKLSNQMQKKISNFLCDASYLNNNVSSKINNFLEFFNIESNKVETNIKQFSLKKLIKDIASNLDQRVKQSQNQLVISHDCPPEMDMIQNDEKKIRHIINYLLCDCIQHTQKGQIVISTQSGAAEMGEYGDLALQGTIKIHIRDNSTRKYTTQKNNDYFFQANNLQKILKNKSQKYEDIEVSVCKQILKMVGPQGNIFYMSEEKNNSNRVSFYIFTDLLQDGEFDISHGKGNNDLLHDEDDAHIDEDDDGQQFQPQIQNSDDDTYKNNGEQSPSQEINQDNQNNPFHSSNQNPSSIYLYHGVDSRNNNQGSGLLFSSQYQLQQPNIIPNTNNFDKYQQQQNQIQNQQIQQVITNHNPQYSSSLQQMQQSQTNYSQSITNNQVDKHSNISSYQIHTLPERNDKRPNYDLKQQELRKSTSQLFDESDKIEDENPVSEVYIKELSQTSVKFKRDITRKLSTKNHFFKNSIDDLEYNSRINSMQRINNPVVSNQLRNNTLNNISKSLVNSLLFAIPVVSIFI